MTETMPETLPERKQATALTDDNWQRARGLKLAGHSWAEISSILGVNSNTMRCRAHREKLPTLTATVNADSAMLRQGVQERRLNSSLSETSQRVRDLLSIDAESTALRLEQYQPDNLRDEWQREQIAGSLVKRCAATFDWASSQSSLVLNVGIMSQLPDSDQSQQADPLDI
jgi:hypothetical protein